MEEIAREEEMLRQLVLGGDAGDMLAQKVRASELTGEAMPHLPMGDDEDDFTDTDDDNFDDSEAGGGSSGRGGSSSGGGSSSSGGGKQSLF
jgi:uncharacterized membrane protein YgcG